VIQDMPISKRKDKLYRLTLAIAYLYRGYTVYSLSEDPVLCVLISDWALGRPS